MKAQLQTRPLLRVSFLFKCLQEDADEVVDVAGDEDVVVEAPPRLKAENRIFPRLPDRKSVV